MSSAPGTPEEKTAADGVGAVVPPKPRLTPKDKIQDAIGEWRKIFGDTFPAYG